MDDSDEWPLYAVSEFVWSDRDQESDITVRCNGKCFHILMSPDYFLDSPSIRDRYLYWLKVADLDDETGDDEDLTVEDLYDWALEPFLPIFRGKAPRPEEQHTLTLHSYFNLHQKPSFIFYVLLMDT